jgi:FMN-dependent NADH-azoreductase
MARLLYVEASPRKDRSHSIAVAREFLAAYADAHPGDEIATLDLWSTPLPELDGAVIDAKYRILHGQPHSPAEAAAWQTVVDVFDRFAAADRYLFSLPMWNFGIPYKLKHLIDVVTQPGLAFRHAPETGYTGLVTGKPAVAIYARGGEYGTTSAMDHQRPYLEMLLRFIGFTEITAITIEPTLAGPDAVGRARAAAAERARSVARGL